VFEFHIASDLRVTGSVFLKFIVFPKVARNLPSRILSSEKRHHERFGFVAYFLHVIRHRLRRSSAFHCLRVVSKVKTRNPRVLRCVCSWCVSKQFGLIEDSYNERKKKKKQNHGLVADFCGRL
jgi:hypothetical protein